MKASTADITTDQIIAIKAQMESLDDVIRGAAMEVEEAESRLSTLEREWDELKDELAALEEEQAKAPNLMAGQIRAGCMDCGLLWPDDSDASRFRAESHSSATGHRIGMVMPGGSPLFEQDCIEMAVA